MRSRSDSSHCGKTACPGSDLAISNPTARRIPQSRPAQSSHRWPSLFASVHLAFREPSPRTPGPEAVAGPKKQNCLRALFPGEVEETDRSRHGKRVESQLPSAPFPHLPSETAQPPEGRTNDCATRNSPAHYRDGAMTPRHVARNGLQASEATAPARSDPQACNRQLCRLEMAPELSVVGHGRRSRRAVPALRKSAAPRR